MKNLARNPKATADVIDELQIASVHLEYDHDLDGEVPTKIYGHLVGKPANFKFHRAWCYWVVRGPVPLEVAQELYADPIGQKDVRVAGHCGCPPPEKPWIHWLDDAGNRLIYKAEYDEVVAEYDEAELQNYVVAYFNKEGYRVVPDVETAGQPYVTSHHIDSQAGLNLFVNKLREHGIVK